MKDLFAAYIQKTHPTYGEIYWDSKKGPFRLYELTSMHNLGPVALFLSDEWEAFQVGYKIKENKE